MAKQPIQLGVRIRQEVEAYRHALKRARFPTFRLIVFGSQAKGTALPDSDIDVAVVSESFGKDRFDEGVQLLRHRNGHFSIEPHPMHPDDLNDRWSPFAQEVRTHGIPVDEE